MEGKRVKKRGAVEENNRGSGKSGVAGVGWGRDRKVRKI